MIPETLVAGGDALARVDGFPIFVPAAYPGDRLRVRVTELKKGFARAAVEAVEVAGPLRRAEPCPVAEECGGCDWTSLRLDAQLEAKKTILIDTLRRIGKIDPAELPPLRIHPSPLNYRLRSRLQFDEETGAVGFFAAKSHRVVPLPAECEVVGARTLEHLPEIRRVAGEAGGGVTIFESDDEVIIEAERTAGRFARLEIGEETYTVRTEGFFQVNRHLLESLVSLVIALSARAAQKRIAFDLYGGVGFFALPLARSFEQVILVENAAASLAAAKQNAASRTNIKIEASDVGDFLRSVELQPDFIMIDPPRAGMTPDVLDSLAKFRGATICLLSCDPVTFSRDVSRLRRHGWRLSTLDLIDLFPNTHHIETLSLLKLAR